MVGVTVVHVIFSKYDTELELCTNLIGRWVKQLTSFTGKPFTLAFFKDLSGNVCFPYNEVVEVLSFYLCNVYYALKLNKTRIDSCEIKVWYFCVFNMSTFIKTRTKHIYSVRKYKNSSKLNLFFIFNKLAEVSGKIQC